MRAEKNSRPLVLVVASLAIGAQVITVSGAVAGDAGKQRFASGLPAATATKFGTRAADPKPPLPPRPAGLRSGDQINLIYDARTKGYTFGRIVAIQKAHQPSGAPANAIVHDHRGKAVRAPSAPPAGMPPPAAPPTATWAPPAAPPGTIVIPPASGKVVRTHEKDVYPDITDYKVNDHREGFGGDSFQVRSFRTATGMTVTVRPRQKPPCYGNACWLFR